MEFKNYKKDAELVDENVNYSLDDGLDMLLKFGKRKFDQTIDVAVNLGIDPKQGDQQVRGAVNLPNGIGKKVTVLVFAKGEKQKEAEDAGADFVGVDDLVDKIKGGWLGFDKVIATPDVMGVVGKLGKILGPRGLMPNPKVGTVTFDITKAVTENKAGKVQYKNDKGGVVHAPVGKFSFGKEKLQQNIKAFVDEINRVKPSGAKGTYLKSITISGTMSPGVKLNAAELAKN